MLQTRTYTALFKVPSSHEESHVSHFLIDINFPSGLYRNPLLPTLPQDGWTAVLLAARYGRQDLVQELCETFGTDFLHRMKVRPVQIVSDSEWLSEMCMYPVML